MNEDTQIDIDTQDKKIRTLVRLDKTIYNKLQAKYPNIAISNYIVNLLSNDVRNKYVVMNDIYYIATYNTAKRPVTIYMYECLYNNIKHHLKFKYISFSNYVNKLIDTNLANTVDDK